MRLIPCLLLSLFISSFTYCQQVSGIFKSALKGRAYQQIAMDSAYRIYAFGSFDNLNGQYLGQLLRFTPEGQLDESFNAVFLDGPIRSIAFQEDGKILVSGSFSALEETSVPKIIRLTSSGLLDETFTSAYSGQANLAIQSTGKIIIHSIQDGMFRRLNTDGSYDTEFVSVFYSTNRPFIIGANDEIFGADLWAIRKFTANGVAEGSFDITPTSGGAISAIATQADGKILVAGQFSKYKGIDVPRFIRIYPDGELDNTFNTGQGAGGDVLRILQRKNGNILLGGQFETYNGVPASLVELNPDGSLSQIVATVYTNWITGIIEDALGKITFSGEFDLINNTFNCYGLARINADYSIDRTFAPQITYNNPNSLKVVALNNGQNAMVASDMKLNGFYSGNQTISGQFFKVDAYCNITSIEGNPLEQWYFALLRQPDDKIIVSGFQGVKRLTPEGTLDNSFDTGLGAQKDGVQSIVYSIHADEDLVYLGGFFSHFNGTPSQSLVAVSSNGSIVKSFDALPPDSFVNGIQKQSDGKIILLGQFTFNGEQKHLIRLKADGTLDESFSQVTMTNPARMAVDGFDNIYVTGSTLNPNQNGASHLVKFNSDGTFNNQFSLGSGFEYGSVVTEIVILPENKIAIGGYFDELNGVESPGFIILNDDGSIYQESNPLFGKGSVVTSISYQNRRIFLAGRFISKDYKSVSAIAKIFLDPLHLPAKPEELEIVFQQANKFSLTWNDVSDVEAEYIIERRSEAEETYRVIATVPANTTNHVDFIERDLLYTYRVRAFNEEGFSPYSAEASHEWNPLPEGNLELTLDAPSEGIVKLNWSTDLTYTDGFIVLQRIGNEEFIPLDTLNGDTPFFNAAIERNTIYQFQIAAYNINGRLSSEIIPIEWLPIPDGNFELQVTLAQPSEVNITWSSEVRYTDSFLLEYATGEPSNFSTLKETMLEADNASIEIQRNIEYFFRVTAINANGVHRSDTVQFEWTPVPEGNLILSIAVKNASEATLTWTDDVKYANGYHVQRSETLNGEYETIATLGNDVNTYEATKDGMWSNSFRVIAFNENGELESNDVVALITSVWNNEATQSPYPNPTRDIVHISAQNSNSNVELTLFDHQGKEAAIASELQGETIIVDLKSLQSGLYILKIRNAEGTRFEKIIKN